MHLSEKELLKEKVIDIHSQHQTYAFMQPKYHIHWLDNYAKETYRELLEEYQEKYKGQGKIKKSDKIRRKQKDKVKNKQRENIKLKTENKQLKKEIDEYENYNKRISEIFEQKTIKNAKIRFQHDSRRSS